MKTKRVSVILLAVLLCLLLFAGCQTARDPVAAPAPTPTETLAPTPASTLVPSPCPTSALTEEQQKGLEEHKATLGGSY